MCCDSTQSSSHKILLRVFIVLLFLLPPLFTQKLLIRSDIDTYVLDDLSQDFFISFSSTRGDLQEAPLLFYEGGNKPIMGPVQVQEIPLKEVTSNDILGIFGFTGSGNFLRKELCFVHKSEFLNINEKQRTLFSGKRNHFIQEFNLYKSMITIKDPNGQQPPFTVKSNECADLPIELFKNSSKLTPNYHLSYTSDPRLMSELGKNDLLFDDPGYEGKYKRSYPIHESVLFESKLKYQALYYFIAYLMLLYFWGSFLRALSSFWNWPKNN